MLLVIFGYEFSIKKQASEYESPFSNKNVERGLIAAKKEPEIKIDEINAESNSNYSFEDNLLSRNSFPIGKFAKIVIHSEAKDINVVTDSDVNIEGSFSGSIKANGNVNCSSDINGSIEADGDINCDGSISASTINAGGDFNCEDIKGAVNCGGDISCSGIYDYGNIICTGELNVDGDITATSVKGNSIDCGSITGNIECNELECQGDITGNISSKGILRV